MSQDITKNKIIEESNRCVSCGLCLPHCPTYRLLKSEADSPRGRIALMNGVASDRIPLNSKFIQHMDRCLTCRACEAVCPNDVRYGVLIDEARHLIRQSKIENSGGGTSLQDWFLRLLLSHPARLDYLRRLFSLAQEKAWFQLARKIEFLADNTLLKLMSQLPPVKFPLAAVKKGEATIGNQWQKQYPAIGNCRGEVGLFLGCVARLTDVTTLNASIAVLNYLGYTVHVPNDQTCCGALHQHRGAINEAGLFTRINQTAFAGSHIQAIISTASGCATQLIESGVDKHNGRIVDISQFLVFSEGWERIEITPLAEKILVHDPCSLRNVHDGQRYPYQLLERIPGVQVEPLANNDQCCGAAGTYFIDQPEISEMLRDDKITAIKESGVRYLVTSNVGCSMHIANGLLENGIEVEVLHSVTLLARQMGLEL
ncbi:(Fe-S)-binding protein [Nitrosomonas sp. wSCUT-2]